mmetsp:Transcript_9500/g.8365  ORF Transcript_9500/g.8365 Transcript_9500/m.8365 type:complete len:127 (+) Transcript_9500:178-558(+)
MKRTDGFTSFKHSIRGGNSSNSLFPSSSGETITSNLPSGTAKVETISDMPTTSTNSDVANKNRIARNILHKEKFSSSNENIRQNNKKSRRISNTSYQELDAGRRTEGLSFSRNYNRDVRNQNIDTF